METPLQNNLYISNMGIVFATAGLWDSNISIKYTMDENIPTNSVESRILVMTKTNYPIQMKMYMFNALRKHSQLISLYENSSERWIACFLKVWRDALSMQSLQTLAGRMIPNNVSINEIPHVMREYTPHLH